MTRTRRRLGVMGGTFDPVHLGHLVAASEVAARLDLDEVVFVPSGLPWQKAHLAVSPAEDRYAMTVLATEADPRFSVSRVEVDRKGPTYTVDTLRALREADPGCDLFFIVGADALAGIGTWHAAEEIVDLAHLVGVTRPGYPEVVPDAGLREGAVTLLEIPALDLSSSDCRARVAAGLPLTYLVPEGVARYVAEHGLYLGEPS